MNIIDTARLSIRYLADTDALFIYKLVNSPGWLRYIGDRGVKDVGDAVHYIQSGPVASYQKHGYGLYLVVRKDDSAPVGICGLVKRDFLENADIGFAFLPQYTGMGYAHESAAAVMHYAKHTLSITDVAAITTQDNERSIQLLKKLGMRYEGNIRYPGEEVELALYAKRKM